MDHPTHTGSAGSRELDHETARALRQRVGAVTSAWHDALCEKLNIRPEAVFPTDELLDHIHLVVEHIIDLIEAAEEVPPRTLAALRDLAEHWQHAGYSVEEALLHFRILDRIMHEELREIIRSTDAELDPEVAARLAESLCHGCGLVQVVIVGTYRDRSEERIADYVSMLSHEIRGPLSAGLTALQTISVLAEAGGGEAEVKRREALQRAEDSLWQANRIVDAVKSLVALGDGNDTEMRPLPDIVATMLSAADGRSEDVAVEWEGDIPDIAVPFEPVTLALHNLIQNAVAYSDPSKPERWVRIRCRHDEEERCWLIDVADNGVGIPKHEQRLIFKRFRRGSSARGEGFGLGLSIVREAAWRINGDVSLQSEPGKGSTFTFSFPDGEVRKRGAASA